MARNPIAAVVLSGAMVATALAATLAATSAGATPADPPPQTMIDAISRDLGISRDQASTRLAQQSAAQQIADALPSEVREHNAGTWLDDRTGKLVVAVTDQGIANQAMSVGAEARMVGRSRVELDRLTRAVAALHTPTVAGVTGWGIDPISNTVVVRVDSTKANATTDRFTAGLTALGAGVGVTRTTGSPVPQGGDVRPGNPWWPGLEGNCSVGFPAVDAMGGKHFVTAGHCTNDRDQTVWGSTGQQNRLGTSNVGGTRSVFAKEGDMGVVAVTEPGWNLSASVNTWGSTPVTVTGTTAPMVNQAVCHSGVTSRWQCGRVTAVEQTVVYSSGPIDGVAFTTACSLAGDSGGAWVAGDKAVGLHSGGYASCNPGGAPDQSLFQPVDEALRKWGLSLYTGGGGGTDTQAPTVPGSLRSTGTTSTSVALAWSASTDNVGVTGYEVLAGGAVVASGATTSATVTGLTPATDYTFTVRARDAAGNASAASAPVTVRTTEGGGGSRTFQNDTDQPIRDYQQITSPIRSTATGSAAAQVRVEVTARHTCVEDLDIYLVSPSGRWYPLHRYGGYVCHPFPSPLTVTVPTSGEQAAGTWSLSIRDGGPGDVGVLDRWSITL